MNLIQIQEYLKEIPIATLIEYANQSNPDVPSWLALTEIERRNKAQQQVQPPEASVKEQIERKAVEQGINQLAADQARQQQAGQQLAQQMTQPTGQVPEGVPEPVQMASGGIARVPVGDIFKFDGGGIVAFAGGGTDTVENPFYEKEEKRKEEPKAPKARQEVRQPVKQGPDYLRMSVEEAMKEPTMPRSPIDILEERKKTSPVLQKPLGADLEESLKRRSEQDIKNQEAFEQRQQDARKRSFWQGLIDAGEASRLGGGIGSVLGGFGKSYGAAQAAEEDRAARQEALRRQQDLEITKLNAEIQNLRRAEERGDIEAAARHEAEIAKIKQKLSETRVATFGQAATTQEQMRHARAMEDLQRQQIGASMSQAGIYARTELEKNLALVQRLYPNLSVDQQLEKAKELSSAAIRGEGAMDVAKQKEVAAIRARYLPMIQMAEQAKDAARRDRLIQEMEEAVRRAQGAGGIANLPQGGGQGWGKAEKVS